MCSSDLDRVPGVSWSLCAMVSRGLEALGGCARRGKRTRSAELYGFNIHGMIYDVIYKVQYLRQDSKKIYE